MPRKPKNVEPIFPPIPDAPKPQKRKTASETRAAQIAREMCVETLARLHDSAPIDVVDTISAAFEAAERGERAIPTEAEIQEMGQGCIESTEAFLERRLAEGKSTSQTKLEAIKGGAEELPDGVVADDYRPDGTVTIPSAKTVGLLTRNLLHVFTKTELKEKRAEREKLDAERDQVLADIEALDVQLKPLKKRLEALTTESFEVSRIVRKGRDYIEVECCDERGVDERPTAAQPDVEGIRTIRLDTGDICDWREFKPSERQGDLF